jgi:hypothetical protein
MAKITITAITRMNTMLKISGPSMKSMTGDGLRPFIGFDARPARGLWQ